jgi:hypothetical protein
MKNLFILTVFALIALTSCKKDYTCECTVSIDGEVLASESNTINDTKSKAADACDEGDESDSSTGYVIKQECEIK